MPRLSDALDQLWELQRALTMVSVDRNAALRIFTASRFGAIASAQREFWLEFAWLDQEYRVAVHRIARFCAEHRLSALTARESRRLSDPVRLRG